MSSNVDKKGKGSQDERRHEGDHKHHKKTKPFVK